jgi:hypothetical protein
LFSKLECISIVIGIIMFISFINFVFVISMDDLLSSIVSFVYIHLLSEANLFFDTINDFIKSLSKRIMKYLLIMN